MGKSVSIGRHPQAWKREKSSPHSTIDASSLSTDLRHRDESVISRLANVESRLNSLERRDRFDPSEANGESPAFSSPPSLHTASSHKMLINWPRLRLNLTLEGFNVSLYLRECDASNLVLVRCLAGNHAAIQLGVDTIISILDQVFGGIAGVPVFFSFVIANSPGFSRDRTVGGLVDRYEHGGGFGAVKLTLAELSLEQLILLSIGLRFSKCTLDIEPSTTELSEICFAICLQRQWMLFSGPDESSVPIGLALAICLMYMWDRPYHALGILQFTDGAINRLALTHQNDE